MKKNRKSPTMRMSERIALSEKIALFGRLYDKFKAENGLAAYLTEREDGCKRE